MSEHWLKDYPADEIVIDGDDAYVTPAVFWRLPTYDSILQPTGPSPGRIYRCPPGPGRDETKLWPHPQQGLLVIVEPDPEDDGFVYRRGRRLFIHPRPQDRDAIDELLEISADLAPGPQP